MNREAGHHDVETRVRKRQLAHVGGFDLDPIRSTFELGIAPRHLACVAGLIA
jgi:hypothetical protein